MFAQTALVAAPRRFVNYQPPRNRSRNTWAASELQSSCSRLTIVSSSTGLASLAQHPCRITFGMPGGRAFVKPWNAIVAGSHAVF